MSVSFFDFFLVLLLVGLGGYLLLSRNLFRSIVLFMIFGLFVTLAWVRLRAPDVALAEAAIGAGVTGALLLKAQARYRSGEMEEVASRAAALILGSGALLTTAALGWGVLSLPPDGEGLAAPVLGLLSESGVTNPVTAVLLNFRGYDTLLEIAVLLLALLGVWSLGPAGPLPAEDPGPIQEAFLRGLAPLLVLVSGYLLWLGGHAPGGAFQAASLLAGGGVLGLLSVPVSVKPGIPLRGLLAGGFLLFLAVALAVIYPGRALLEYPPGWAKGLILLIESGLTLSVAAILVVLFAGGRPGGKP